MKKIVAVLALAASVGACGRAKESREGPQPSAELPKVDQGVMLERIRVLASDEFEGRAPGTKGEDLTIRYLVDEMRKLGLQPGNPDGSYVQKVPLVGMTGSELQPLTVSEGTKKQAFKWADDVVPWTKRVIDSSSISGSDLVFVGYGVAAPEYNWDDFKDVDVKGKTIIVLINDPQVPDAADPAKLDARLFNGKAMTYYGRWTYKFEEGARRGAAGILVVHETGPAGYPFAVVQGNLREKFDVVTPHKNMDRAAIEGWLSLDAAKKILAMAGQNFDELKNRALTREFRPVPLGLKASLGVKNAMRTIDSQNVLGRLEGSDPRMRDEYIVYSAHWDHLGVGTPVSGDRIYNGAVDNASGVAAQLEIARSLAGARPRPKRSILFLFVTAEEQGLVGSYYYATNPLYPLQTTVANINIDGVNQWGRTKDVTVVGMGASDLEDVLREAAASEGRTLNPDPEPEKGFYYRSDHFNFAKVGVPALYIDTGEVFEGRDASYSRTKRDEYTSNDYHKPSDHIKADWNLGGAAQDADLLVLVGYRVANADRVPEWKPGNEFKARRDAMMKK